jgi:flagellin-like protein
MITSRRGISPLIATILLLAFAVAIGTMAVSYLVDATRTDACDNARLAFQEGAPACYRDGRVSVILTNRDEQLITSATVKFVNANGDLDETRAALALNSGSATKVDLPYQTVYPQGVVMTVTPAIMHEGKEKFCFERELTTTLTTCGTP